MSEFKYIQQDDNKRISLDQVTTSDAERTHVESQMNTVQENQKISDANMQRNADQKTLWEEQAKNVQRGVNEAQMTQNNITCADQLKENGIDNLRELRLSIDKIGKFLLEQSVEWRREYTKEGMKLSQKNGFFDGYSDLSDKEEEIFVMLKGDSDISVSMQGILSSEVAQNDFLKKTIRVERKTEYKMYLADFIDSNKK